MLKIFRKIRQKFLAENKLGQYSLYALGEILLVVVGILIALQINNISNGIKDRKLESDYYCRLLEDANSDKQKISELINNAKVKQKLANKLTKSAIENQTIDSLSTTYKMLIRGSSSNFKPVKSAFTDLTSGSNLNIISDITFKDNLMRYYSQVEDLSAIAKINIDRDIRRSDAFMSDPIKTGYFFAYEDYLQKSKNLEAIKILNSNKSSMKFLEYQEKYQNEAIHLSISQTRRNELYLEIANKVDNILIILKNKCNNSN